MTLEAGASVLLPPVQERLEMLLSILPEDPSSIVGLTTGQVCTCMGRGWGRPA
jgi:hypothetical protein